MYNCTFDGGSTQKVDEILITSTSARFAMDRDLMCAEQTTRHPALPGWSFIGPPELRCLQLHIMFPYLIQHLVHPQVRGADSRQVCWWHKMWEGENVTFFEGKETQVQELIFRSKIGRNQLAHGFTFLSKVPLEVCGQGCVTEEAPEEWSSFNSSHAFVPLCIFASFHLSLFRTKGQQTPSEYYQL